MCYSDNSIAFHDDEVLSHAGQKGDERPTVKKPPEKFGWSTRDPTKGDPTKLAGPPPTHPRGRHGLIKIVLVLLS